MVDEVLHLLSQINLEWYYSKKEAFKNEPLFDKEREKIYHDFIIDESYVDDEGLVHSDKRNLLINIEFVDYCWDSGFLYSIEKTLSELEGQEMELPVSLKTISYNVLKVLDKYFSVTSTPNNIAAAVLNILEKVVENLNNNLKNIEIEKPDKSKKTLKLVKEIKEEYSAILSNFITKLRMLLQHKYKRHLVLAHLEIDYDENSRLVFDVSQDELSALLYVLNAAGFFRLIAPGDTHFINFCKERFYYSKGVEKVPTKASDLRRKYN
jgi:hypothetical protein